MTSAEASAASLREIAELSHAWPFEEARKIVARLKRKPEGEVIFETGYGPSGLPHIGTFGEVARTSMVRHAFRVLTDDKIKTRLIAFSDDMDGLRKVPDNVPNKEMVAAHLGKPLTQVPDPFGTHSSFAAHNNARLRAFLDQFGFDYEFMSSTACYTSGRFDAALLQMLAHFEQVMEVMLPSLREERAQTYSPFLPIDEKTGIVLQVPVVAHDAKAGTITYENNRERVTTPVTGGRCKLQWKPDWAMRWVALGVDYEMAGKDLIDSVKLSSEICRVLGSTPPEGFNYELFLDENGQKISKSKGNGLTIEEWLRYASPESLSLFMYREPKAAKRLYFDVIPRHVDEYLQFLDAYPRQAAKERLGNPVWHIHGGAPPKSDNPVPFAMLLSLVTASNAANAETLWGFVGRYRPGVTRQTHPKLAALVDYAVNYYRDFVAPTKKFREPGSAERAALIDLRDALSQLPADAAAEAIQDVVYEVGRREPFLDQKKKAKDGKPGVSLDWFNMLYQVLLGQERGPRFGSFVAAYGIGNTVDMIDGALARSTHRITVKIDDSFLDSVCNFGVGFLKFENKDQDATPAGTGTLARLGKVSGIVTAGHVIRNLPKAKVGLVRFPSIQPMLQNFKLDIEHTDSIVMWNGKDGEAPDIGFIRIPELDAKDLESKGSVFYNLGIARNVVARSPTHQMSKCYAIVGVVAEWTDEEPGKQPNTKKKIVGGLFGAAKITKEFNEAGIALVEVEIDYASGPKVPTSYEGVSGGGLWELYVELDGQKVVRVNKKLHGIAFRQSKDHRLIVSNGEPSIEELISAIRQKWPGDI